MNFEMLGKLSIGKETDKFKPFTESKYESGWVRRQLLFNVTCGDNRHMLTIQKGAFPDGDVYTFSKGSVDADGKKTKGELLKIPFKDRLTSPLLAEVAEYKKFVFDLEKPGRRYKLQRLADDIHEGKDVTDEALKEVGLESVDEVASALEKSNKKHHEFIFEWDFMDFIKKVVDSGKYTDAKFHIRGNGEYQYSENKQQVYESYVPSRIYLANDDEDEYSSATINLIFNADSLDEGSVEEKGKYYVSGHMMEYDNNRRANIPVPVSIVIPAVYDDEKEKKKVERIKHKFIVEDDTYKEYGVVVNMLNGAQKTEITEDMLTDDQKEDLECGLITLDDIRAELGGSVYGERIREYQFVKPAKGFTKGRQDTVYTDDDMVIRPLEKEDENTEEDLFQDENAVDDDEL